jgi:hypothetical protein
MESPPNRKLGDARTLTGLEHWAATLGIDSDNALAIVSSILGGLAGPVGYISLPWGMITLPALHLIVPATQGMLPHACDVLLSPARRINRQILETMAGINPAQLNYVRYASFAGDPAKVNPRDGIESVALRNLREGPAFDPETRRVSNGEGDLAPDPIQRRVEAIFRPGLLNESSDPSDILKLLPGTHLSHALGGDITLRSLISSPRKKKDIESLLRIINGTEVVMPSPKFPVSIEHSRAARLQAIFKANPGEIRQLLPNIAPLLEQTVILVDTSTASKPNQHSAYFGDLFGRITTRIALTRRNGVPLVAKFGTPETASRFQQEAVSFIGLCDAVPVPVGSSIRNLPHSMAWTLMMLRQHMKQQAPPGDDEVITAVFDASRNLLLRHVHQMKELSLAAEREEMIQRARKIVRKIQDKQLITFSGLVRTFDQQNTSLYRPVVDILVEAKVLNRKSDGKLSIGNRPFDEALPNLFFASLTER